MRTRSTIVEAKENAPMHLAITPLIMLSLITVTPPPPPPMSGFMNAERLVEHCRPGDSADVGMADVCLGYIAGSVDQLLAAQAQLPSNKRTICVAPSTTIGQIQRAVIADLDMFIDQPNVAAAVLVERSMTAAFPC
jgi:hypothetical protein